MDDLRGKYIAAISGAADEAALEEIRIAALGKKGEISALMATLGKMEPEARKAEGARLNAMRDEIDGALRARKAALGLQAVPAGGGCQHAELLDHAAPQHAGSRHLAQQAAHRDRVGTLAALNRVTPGQQLTPTARQAHQHAAHGQPLKQKLVQLVHGAQPKRRRPSRCRAALAT